MIAYAIKFDDGEKTRYFRAMNYTYNDYCFDQILVYATFFTTKAGAENCRHDYKLDNKEMKIVKVEIKEVKD